MCKSDPNQLETLVRQAVAGTGAVVTGIEAPSLCNHGSRRKRLWELDGHAHCPVVGVCLPISLLRKVVNKALGGQAVADDYELHCGAVADCKQRGAVAEAVQRELERRYVLAVQKAGKLKTTEALAAWWDEALRCQDIAGPLWATLTHARCTPELAHRVEGQVHMLQHQVGMATRMDFDRFEALLDENALLTRELAAAQQRSTRQVEEHTRRQDALQSLVMQLRAQLMARDTAVAALQADLQTLEAASPGLKTRFEMARELERLVEHNHSHQRALLHAQQESERQRRRADDLAAELAQRDAIAADATADTTTPELPARLDDQAVLCVGGRPASVPIYRQLIEGTGGRFMHHDGGEEDSDAKLDATLAAADLVICQTGCISHNAYWRVKDHCKRTGKRCVFVESPSRAGLGRALRSLAVVEAPSPGKASSTA
ncbi:DUF2325 domain-containing protein [Sphaerotilus sp.]|uniref:DUF2325 domain-containing protein n=1 Tax=Sphaerotilus sp. TaxID=2093942 RepID=UPI002ACE5E58|nr:DUF2325 domain-containing protein [Sphaerotilus sp.]MDZ7855813.1 DUF2325 domain-containing protein [Sphaerotilus sp.]